MNDSAQHVATLVDAMILKVRRGELTTDQGLSFLEMKYNTLLSYLINLTYIVLRKCSGESIEGDPCIDRLVEIRTVLERIRPINNKLKYQIDKLVKTAVTRTDLNDATAFKANPAELMEDEESEEEDEPEISGEKKKAGVYVPPKLSAVHYNDEKEDRRERTKKLSLASSIVQDLREEYLDAPIEISQTSRAQQITSKKEQERQEYEETYLTRLPMNKEEKRMRRRLTTVGTLGDEITDFGRSGGGTKRKRKSLGKGKRFKRKRKN